MLIANHPLSAGMLLGAVLAVLMAPPIDAGADASPAVMLKEVLWATSRLSALAAERGGAGAQTDRSTEAYVLREGVVLLDVDAFLPFDAQTGKRAVPRAMPQSRSPADPAMRQLLLSPFTDIAYSVQITSESSPVSDVRNLSGRLPDAELDSVAITVTAGGYIISVQDLERQRLYRIVGDAETGYGRVTEIDLTALPARRCETLPGAATP